MVQQFCCGQMRWLRYSEPIEELEAEYYRFPNASRKEIIKILSKEFVEEHLKSLNENFLEKYTETVLDLDGSDEYYIKIYSREALSKVEMYVIASAYKHLSQFQYFIGERTFFDYVSVYYKDIVSLTSRVKLYKQSEDHLLIVIDIEPEEIGLDVKVMKYTKNFNKREENGEYKTVISAYVDFSIVALSKVPLLIEEVELIMKAHNIAQSHNVVGEGGQLEMSSLRN